RHTRSLRDWSSDVCSSDLVPENGVAQSINTCTLLRFPGFFNPLGGFRVWEDVNIPRRGGACPGTSRGTLGGASRPSPLSVGRGKIGRASGRERGKMSDEAE